MNNKMPGQSLSILLAVHTVADWGGLQDWAVGMAVGLSKLGNRVILVSNNPLMIERSEAGGAEGYLIDWSEWPSHLERVAELTHFDVIFAQPFSSREFSITLSELRKIPVVYMSHGNNLDFMYSWQHEVSRFLVASSSLSLMLSDLGRVPNERIAELPNGFPDVLVDRRILSYDERIINGEAHFMIAARLMPDKVSQIEGMKVLVKSALESGTIRSAVIDVYGGGPSEAEFRARLDSFASEIGSIKVRFHGWVEQSIVLDALSSAFFSVAGGVTGTQSVALGTPCLGAGIRGMCGVSTPDNMNRVLGSNFGDHTARFSTTPSAIEKHCQWMLIRENFAKFQDVYVPYMRKNRTHGAIAKSAFEELKKVII